VSAMAPYACVAAVGLAALLVPVVYVGTFGFIGDLLLLIYLLAIVKFVHRAGRPGRRQHLRRHGLEQGDVHLVPPSSRPCCCPYSPWPWWPERPIWAVSPATVSSTGVELIEPSLFLAAAAFAIATLAENARIPVDNPSTHLELTMVHEAMLLEYSGKDLALMEFASMAKLMIFLTVLANIFFPWGIAASADPASPADRPRPPIWPRSCCLLLFIAVIESSMAKMRLFPPAQPLHRGVSPWPSLAVVAYYILGGGLNEHFIHESDRRPGRRLPAAGLHHGGQQPDRCPWSACSPFNPLSLAYWPRRLPC